MSRRGALLNQRHDFVPRATQPDARILFTSGYTEDAAVRQSFLQPGEAFIEKPFTPARLAEKAREILEPQAPSGRKASGA